MIDSEAFKPIGNCKACGRMVHGTGTVQDATEGRYEPYFDYYVCPEHNHLSPVEVSSGPPFRPKSGK